MTTKSPPSSPPPSSIRPPPAEPGSAKYLLVMLLLGGGMVGLFVWHKSQAEVVVVAPPPSASAALLAAHAPHDEPIEIPPPPPVEPSATAVKSTGSPGGGGGGDACSQTTCNGRISPELSSALSFRGKTAHRCYDEALAQDPTLNGQVVIAVHVASNGTVCSANVASNDVANPGVGACIANKFRLGARLPAPIGGCLDVNVPMQLHPPH